jgi:hypothetical protein
MYHYPADLDTESERGMAEDHYPADVDTEPERKNG